MRSWWILPVLVAMGCSTSGELPIVSSEYALHVLHAACGPEFDSKRYDVTRELSREQRAEIEKEVKAFHASGHSGTRTVGIDVPASLVVEEVQRLQGGCSVALCNANSNATLRRSERLVPFVVITRDSVGELDHAKREAHSAIDALKQPATRGTPATSPETEPSAAPAAPPARP